MKKIPMSWWKRLQFQAVIRFKKWLYPRPKLFKWLNVSLLISLLTLKSCCAHLWVQILRCSVLDVAKPQSDHSRHASAHCK